MFQSHNNFVNFLVFSLIYFKQLIILYIIFSEMGTYESKIKSDKIRFVLYRNNLNKKPVKQKNVAKSVVEIPKQYLNQAATTINQTELGQELGKGNPRESCEIIEITDVYPYSCFGLLVVYFGQAVYNSAATLIGESFVLTAAQNLYNKEKKLQATKVKFVVGVKGKNCSKIYGVRKIHIPSEYKESNSKEQNLYNYAIIKLEERNVDDEQGNIGLFIQYKQKNDKKVQVIGYPRDQGTEKKLLAVSREFQITADKKILYNNKILKERDFLGSAILVKDGQDYKVIGVEIANKQGLILSYKVRNQINHWVKENSYKLDIKQQIKSQPLQEIKRITNEKLDQINDLDLSRNNIGNKGVKVLVLGKWPSLKILNLMSNNIGPEGINFLIECKFPKLINLILRSNSIGSEGCQKMEVLSAPNLKQIDLSYNKIGSDGVLHIKNWNWKNLEVIRLNNNNIGSEGVKYILDSEWLSPLRINLNGNNFDENSISKLDHVFQKSINYLKYFEELEL